MVAALSPPSVTCPLFLPRGPPTLAKHQERVNRLTPCYLKEYSYPEHATCLLGVHLACMAGIGLSPSNSLPAQLATLSSSQSAFLAGHSWWSKRVPAGQPQRFQLINGDQYKRGSFTCQRKTSKHLRHRNREDFFKLRCNLPGSAPSASLVHQSKSQRVNAEPCRNTGGLSWQKHSNKIKKFYSFGISQHGDRVQRKVCRLCALPAPNPSAAHIEREGRSDFLCNCSTGGQLEIRSSCLPRSLSGDRWGSLHGSYQLAARCRGPRPPGSWWDKWLSREVPPGDSGEAPGGSPEGAPSDRPHGENLAGNNARRGAQASGQKKILEDYLLGESFLFPEEENKAESSSAYPESAYSRLTRSQRMELIGGPEEDVDAIINDEEKFRTWWRRRQAILELREAQVSGKDPDDVSWEDWLDDSMMTDVDLGGWYEAQPDWEQDGMPRAAPKLPERGMRRNFKELLLKVFQRGEEVEAELTFEERVFRFTSQTTAKFVTCLIIFPWLIGFVAHDFILVPFMHRWVESTPLAYQLLDVREKQKLQVIGALKLERQRARLEAEIGRTPPLSDEDLAEHMHEEAVMLMEEVREENRSAFANIWSDALAGLSGFAIFVLNPKQVAIMRMTGDRIFTNISDTGKAFIIILCTDIFLGYHSESGWETVIDMFLEHYGFESDQGSIYLFVATVPVTMDVLFKLWVFRYLNRLSPSAAATLREMKRH